MPIYPLPVILEEEEQERQAIENLRPPTTIVVRYGYLKQIAELSYDGKEIPGCGSKLVARTPRGIELVTMLTTSCSNDGCSHSVSRKHMLSYIDQSGGKQFPFTEEGKILRIATPEDVREQEHLDNGRSYQLSACRKLIEELDMPMKLVDVELLLGGDRVIFYFMAESRVDFRDLVKKLASEFRTRIEMRQVGARDEARIVADYEKCGQQCCCKQFLKVLKPISMRAAKTQKATLDPTKISGRCGRLMCCLRYEEKTYEFLRQRLPNRNTRVLTEDGIGTVLSSQTLTQLVLVALDELPQAQAYPIEDIRLLTKDEEEKYKEERDVKIKQELAEEQEKRQQEKEQRQAEQRQRQRQRQQQAAASRSSSATDQKDGQSSDQQSTQKRKKPRRQPQKQKQSKDQQSTTTDQANQGEQTGAQKKKRRRKRRRRGGKKPQTGEQSNNKPSTGIES